MPNGGSDCCGTCCFNSSHKGEWGYVHSTHPSPEHCAIRHFNIENPYYTYCTNHPYRNPDKLTVPIGPVFITAARKVWKLSPDTEEIRLTLLELLRKINEKPTPEYPHGFYLDEIVIQQLAEFKEKRAVEDLKRITAFNARPSPHPYFRDNIRTVNVAKQALEQIVGDMGRKTGA